MAEFVELGEETGGDLQSLELEKEIKGFENVVVFIRAGCSGTSTGFQSVEEGTKTGAKPHQAVASLGSLGKWRLFVVDHLNLNSSLTCLYLSTYDFMGL